MVYFKEIRISFCMERLKNGNISNIWPLTHKTNTPQYPKNNFNFMSSK
jgi:hypothetical protein